MSAIELHLALNHLPVVGALAAVATLLAGLRAEAGALRRWGAWLAAVVGALAAAAYLTGQAAEEAAERFAAARWIEAHEEAALWGLLAAAAVGAVALGMALRRTPPSRRAAGLLAAGELAAFLALGWTARQGGLIRHEELRPPTAAPTVGGRP